MKPLVYLLLCCLVGTIYADNRVARVLYYGAPANAPEVAFVHQAEMPSQEVELGRHNFSDSFDLGPGAIRLALLPSALPEGEPVPAGAPSVAIPEGWNKVLILVFKDKSNPIMPIQLKAINANDDEFGPGELYFVNFSEMTVFGMVGEKRLISKPRTAETISAPRSGRGKYMLKLNAFKDDPEKRRRLIQQRCHYDPTARVLTFMVPLPAPRMVKLYSAPIKDF